MNPDLNKFFSPSLSPEPTPVFPNNPQVKSNTSNVSPKEQVPDHNEFSDLTTTLLKTLQTRVSPTKFDLYFHESISISQVSNKNVIITANTNFIKAKLKQASSQSYKTHCLKS